MQNYDLLYIIPLYIDPKKSIEYYTNKIEEKGGQIIKSDIFTGDSLDLQAKEKLEGNYIFIQYSINKQYFSYITESLRNDIDIIRYIVIDTTNDKVDNKGQQEEDSAPKCPFCGGEFHLQLCDEEGNPHREDYLEDPYSGVSYFITHTHSDVPEGTKCPIAKDDNSEPIGCYLYDTKEEAIAALKLRGK